MSQKPQPSSSSSSSRPPSSGGTPQGNQRPRPGGGPNRPAAPGGGANRPASPGGGTAGASKPGGHGGGGGNRSGGGGNRGGGRGGFRGGRRSGGPPAAKETGNAKEECLELEGTIHTVLPGTMFRVELDNGHLVLAHISGKMRKRFIKLVTGDRVKMEMSAYDTDKARITYRLN